MLFSDFNKKFTLIVVFLLFLSETFGVIGTFIAVGKISNIFDVDVEKNRKKSRKRLNSKSLKALFSDSVLHQ